MVSSNSETEHDDEDEIEMHAYQEPATSRPCDPKKPISSLGRVYRSLKLGIPGPLKNFWNNQVSVTVSHDKCRDHFGMDEKFAPIIPLLISLVLYPRIFHRVDVMLIIEVVGRVTSRKTISNSTSADSLLLSIS